MREAEGQSWPNEHVGLREVQPTGQLRFAEAQQSAVALRALPGLSPCHHHETTLSVGSLRALNTKDMGPAHSTDSTWSSEITAHCLLQGRSLTWVQARPLLCGIENLPPTWGQARCAQAAECFYWVRKFMLMNGQSPHCNYRQATGSQFLGTEMGGGAWSLVPGIPSNRCSVGGGAFVIKQN